MRMREGVILGVLVLGSCGQVRAQALPETSAQNAGDLKDEKGKPFVAPTTRTERADMLQNAPLTIFRLQYPSQPNDANELVTGLRLMLNPSIKLYLVPSQNAIAMRGLPDDVALASKLVHELDRPHRSYRVLFTVTDKEGGKTVGTQHFAIIAVDGMRTTLKEGSKVPVATGSYSPSGTSSEGSQTQFTYLDVGMNFDVTVVGLQGSAMLKAKVEQSSVGEEKAIMGINEPVIRQAVIEGNSVVTLGKPTILGAVDVPGSTRHLDIEVMVEARP